MDHLNAIALPAPLCPTNKSSFAYKTIKDRLPVIITRAIDFIYRFRNDLINRYPDSTEDTKSSIERLSQLRYEITTDKPLRLINDNGDDTSLWNDALTKLESNVGTENTTWFKAPWLFTECYMYRRIREAMLNCTSNLKYYDPYEEVKKEAYKSSESTIIGLIKGMCPISIDDENIGIELLKQKCETIIYVSLWSNKNDLSISAGTDNSEKIKDLIDLIDHYNKNLIKNQTNRILDEIFNVKKRKIETRRRFDIVLDNTGIESLSDFILSDFLLSNSLFDEIHLHLKSYAWFVSDLTLNDYEFMVKQLQRVNSIQINRFLRRIESYKQDGRLLFKTSPFWTSPYSFWHMNDVDTNLYEDLKKSDLILFKGDLNYRKLFNDLDWPINTSLEHAIGNFKPAPIIILRTLKSDIAVDLDESDVKRAQSQNKDWMIVGDYGLIQFLNVGVEK